MVQVEPSLQLVLKHLAPCGTVLPAETTVGHAIALLQHGQYYPCDAAVTATPCSQPQVALDHSLPIKRSEAGLKSLVLWGRLLARNGKVGEGEVT